jgi:NAD(P)-dependent dehydrogenase (short-subunit alcohol dehydrogenase family)
MIDIRPDGDREPTGDRKARIVKVDGKVAVVTGASRGIGKGIAMALAREGAAVVVNARHARGAEAVAAEIRANGAQAAAFAADVGNTEEAEALVGFAVETFGRLDVLVNNAGVSRPALLVEATDEDWDETLRVNARGVFICSRAAARRMLAQGGGRIVNVASRSGKTGLPYEAAYSASKFAVIALTQVAARELASKGITVNAICPGRIETEMMLETFEKWGRELHLTPDECRSRLVAEIPAGRLGTVEDIGQLAVFLASDAAAYVTGQSIHVGGGLDMG